MNRSIILVMCDILVLSAMSLSSGGFTETDELDVTKTQSVDFDVVSRDAYETLQQQFEEIERSASEQLAKAAEEVEAARAKEANAKAMAETAQKKEALAKSQAEEASAQTVRARQEAEAARVSEVNAKAVAETARKNEAEAKAQAEEAQKREVEAKIAEKAAKEAEALAKSQAEEATAQAARARQEAEVAFANEAQALAKAEAARKNEADAKGLADKLQAELDEIHARQNALIGNIPQNLVWEMTISMKGTKGKKGERKTLFSPLFSLEGEGFLFFELPQVSAKTCADVDSVIAGHREFSATGGLFRVKGHDDWLFVKVCDSSKFPHIGFGVEPLGLEGNIVFYPEKGVFEGDPVKCERDSKGNFSCSNKTENRNGIQQLANKFSVFKGCFIVSTNHGAIGAVVTEGSRHNISKGMLRCEILNPISVKDLLPVLNGN